MDIEIDGFEWDPSKAQANYHKHRVTFEEAQFAVLDAIESDNVSKPFRSKDGETRFDAWGTGFGRPVVVVFTLRREGELTFCRIISAQRY